MFKHIDDVGERVQGFKYHNLDGDEEYVSFDGICVEIVDRNNDRISIYVADVPKLIKALKSAYDHQHKG